MSQIENIAKEASEHKNTMQTISRRISRNPLPAISRIAVKTGPSIPAAASAAISRQGQGWVLPVSKPDNPTGGRTGHQPGQTVIAGRYRPPAEAIVDTVLLDSDKNPFKIPLSAKKELASEYNDIIWRTLLADTVVSYGDSVKKSILLIPSAVLSTRKSRYNRLPDGCRD